jgi:hypothetical protein
MKTITTWSHFSMENSSERCTCRHLPAFHPVVFPTAYQSAFCWTFHRLQWWKRCSHVCSVPHLHDLYLSSSRCPNRFRYVLVGACPFFSLLNIAASDFTLVIGTDHLLLALPFSL